MTCKKLPNTATKVELEDAHDDKMRAKKAFRRTLTVRDLRGPTRAEVLLPGFARLPKTDGKIDLRPRPNKSDNPEYRKPFARDFNR